MASLNPQGKIELDLGQGRFLNLEVGEGDKLVLVLKGFNRTDLYFDNFFTNMLPPQEQQRAREEGSYYNDIIKVEIRTDGAGMTVGLDRDDNWWDREGVPTLSLAFQAPDVTISASCGDVRRELGTLDARNF